jgi:peptide methionine sulfoxide reductase MsrA
MKFIASAFLAISALFILTPLSAQQLDVRPTSNPVELGKINWLRNYDEAVALSEKSNKPIFILFQEVPGCSTCSRFGFGPLSDPFLVEAIEDNFVALAIHNNKRGEDARILKQFNEPSWNNPVVRIVNAKGKDIVPRMANRWSPEDLLSTVIAGVEKSQGDVPMYLSMRLAEEQGRDNIKEANLSMYCFWTGEKEISKIDGVLSTEAGFMHGREVVKISYDASQVTLPNIVKAAEKVNCADAVYVEDDYDLAEVRKFTDVKNVKKASSYHKDKEVKYYLSKSNYRFIPMSKYQQAKVNAAIGSQQNPNQYLSPRQLLAYKYIKEMSNKKWTSQINQDMEATWYSLLDEIAMKS